MEDLLNRVVCGDALAVLKTMPSESVDMVVTSPPYWALRDYGVKGQLGLEPDFNLYIKHLCDIFDEVRRVLKKEGTCFVNLGDTYGGSGNSSGHTEETKNLGYTTSKMGASKGNQYATKGMEKCLLQIPSRFAIEMCNRDWILRNRLIWHKPNCMPSSAEDRFTVDFEDIFFFTKNKHYYFEQQFEPYTEQINRWGGSKLKANGNSSWDTGTGQDTFRDRDMRPNKLGRNKRCVWSIPTKPSSVEHYASYPEALIETPIKAGCPKDGIVMDIFAGSGTTLKVAKQLGRRFIGVELSPEYCAIAQKRLSAVSARLDTFCVNKPLTAIKL